MARKEALCCLFIPALLLHLALLHGAASQQDYLTTVDQGRRGSEAITHSFDWKVEQVNMTRLNFTKPVVVVNGQFPGPTVYIREGDRVVIKVTNLVAENVTLHWHGVKMMLQNWYDGPAYITQCPIQTGDSFTYDFTVDDQRGTVLWHAHITWLRATLYGGFIILPRKGVPYPFPQPASEQVLIFGEWWNADTEAIEVSAVRRGAGYNISDALTINGQPGLLYNFSAAAAAKVEVEAGRTYLLRLINAALNFDLFFGIANHTMQVVAVDADYTKALNTTVVVLTPGQTTDVLVRADQGRGRFYMAASVFSPAPSNFVPFPTVPTTATLEYAASSNTALSQLPLFPAFNHSRWVLDFDDSLKSLGGQGQSGPPTNISDHLFFTVGYNVQLCKPEDGCGRQNGTSKLITTVNNVTFVLPQTSILEAYYRRLNNVYSPDFPDDPPFVYNFTGPIMPVNLQAQRGTKVNVLRYGATVQLVLQNTNINFFESHPFHLHGFSFYVVGSAFGTFNASTSPAGFNLVDPPLRNTVAVPAAGWTAIRFKADNPGVWFMHCHLEIHTSWGMSMAFIVLNGQGKLQSLPTPPPGMPNC